MPIITIVGSLNYDVVTTMDRLPEAGETIPAKNFETHNGGKGANQALACSRLRSNTSDSSSINTFVQMVGCVGDDTFGKTLTKSLADSGVDVSKVRVLKKNITGEKEDNVGTGVATILVDAKTGQNRILVYPGANSKVNKQDVLEAIVENDNTGSIVKFKTDTLVLQNEIPVSLVQDVIRTITQTPKIQPPLIVYNPSPIDSSFDVGLYRYVDCLIVNSTEARAIVSKSVGSLLVEDDNSEQALLAAVPIFEFLELPKYLVITLGASGCVYVDGSKGHGDKLKAIHLPAVKPPKPVIDTTGAGDTFLGALTTHLTEGKSLEYSIRVALTASSIAVTRRGAGDGIPEFRELDIQ